MHLKKWIWLLVLFVPVAVQAARVAVYSEKRGLIDSLYVEPEKKFPRLEVYADGVLSYGTIKDRNGDALSRRMIGARGGMLVGVAGGFLAGLEVEKLKAVDQQIDYLSTFKRENWQAVVKWIATPDTEGIFYVVGGLGRVRQETSFGLKSYSLTEHSYVISAGGGIEWPIWKVIKLKGEYRAMYDVTRWKNFLIVAPRVRHELSAGLLFVF